MDAVKAVFLDRDGVINENRDDHVKDWAEFRFLPGAVEAIARLSQAGVRAFVITNQAVVNRGIVRQATVEDINRRMVDEIAQRHGRIEAVAYCPHRPDEQCECRKPKPGLILDLARRYHLDPRETVVIGDALTDLEAGLGAGCQGILVLTGRGRRQLAQATAAGANGFAVATDLDAAADLVLQRLAVAGHGVRRPAEGVS